ncbi:multidrug effflux MFS transporter [Hyphomonas sp. NPDC076900]|uniref:multidrug effflux MFS transporter n=1 Tax=unclassified Hyphomonas TaxID=2630699 RepID=UPI003D03B2E3
MDGSEAGKAEGLHMPPPAGMRKVEFVAIVAGLMALNAIAIDIMLPALGEIARATGLTAEGGDQNRQQLIIFAYVLGFGAPQLIWGPITDRFGRRAPLFVALAGYMLMAFLCVVAHSFWALLAARFLQGVFSSGARTVASAVVRDLFAGRAMASFMSLVMTVFMIVPIIAPAIGQMILYVAPWEGIFIVLAVWGGLMFAWTWFRLPESLPKAARQSLEIGSVMSAYMQVIRTRASFGYMLASGLVFGSLFAFIASSEQVFRDVFDQGDTFAYWFAGIAAALALSNFANSRLVERMGMRRISHIALLTFIISTLLLTLATLIWGENLTVFFPLFAIGFACFGMMGSNFSALAMEPLGKIAGTASAAYGFATTMISSIIGMIIGAQFDGTTVPLSFGFVILGVASLLVILVTEKGRLFSRY